MGLFTGLADQLDQKHSLYLLANRVDWPFFEDAFKKYYSEKMGVPAKPIRLMVSLLILKSLRNLSDENLIEKWTENIYFQYGGGEQYLQPPTTCVPTVSTLSPACRFELKNEWRKEVNIAGISIYGQKTKFRWTNLLVTLNAKIFAEY